MIGPKEPESEEELYAYDTDSYMIYGTDMLNVSYVVERLSGELYLKWLNPDASMSVSFYNLSTGVYDTCFGAVTRWQKRSEELYCKGRYDQSACSVADANEDHYMPVFTVSEAKRMIEIRHLYKAFDNHMVLRNLNMKINDGAVYGFVGPNGAGKTTTMRIIAGLLKATADRF